MRFVSLFEANTATVPNLAVVGVAAADGGTASVFQEALAGRRSPIAGRPRRTTGRPGRPASRVSGCAAASICVRSSPP
ncbi:MULTISPECIES: DUF6207 family protein [Streptomyces]|uniref:DUF6207 family protein n=1 Tax=Streptomyces fimbriatus TaxID=68197 RepID=A0ABW0D8N7_STRFI